MNTEIISTIIKQLNGKFDEKDLKTIERVLFKNLKNKEIRDMVKVQPQTNEEALACFISAKKVEGCSLKSLVFYQTTLRKMLDELKSIYYSITTEELRAYLSQYQEEHNTSKATIDNMRRIISSFFSWLENEDYIVKSPARRIHKVKTMKVVKEVFSEENVELIRQNCTSERDLAIVDMLYSTGIRVGELVRLNIKDLDFNSKECVD